MLRHRIAQLALSGRLTMCSVVSICGNVPCQQSWFAKSLCKCLSDLCVIFLLTSSLYVLPRNLLLSFHSHVVVLITSPTLLFLAAFLWPTRVWRGFRPPNITTRKESYFWFSFNADCLMNSNSVGKSDSSLHQLFIANQTTHLSEITYRWNIWLCLFKLCDYPCVMQKAQQAALISYVLSPRCNLYLSIIVRGMQGETRTLWPFPRLTVWLAAVVKEPVSVWISPDPLYHLLTRSEVYSPLWTSEPWQKLHSGSVVPLQCLGSVQAKS